MKIKTTKKILAVSLCLAANLGFSQFTGDVNDNFGTSGNLWYNYNGLGATSEITKLVLDENSNSLYFSGALNNSGYNAIIVKASEDGVLDGNLTYGTINYDPFIGLDDRFEAVAVQDNGKMVGAGYSIIGPGDSDIIIARFNTDGTLDPTFNGGAPIVIDAYGGLDFATDVVMQPDGKIVVIGSYQASPTDLNLFVVRLNSDGSFDGTFGSGGLTELDTYSGVEIITSVYILSTGKIAAVGQAASDLLITMLDEDGNFDTNFSGDGSLNFKVNSLPTYANKLVELPDTRLLIAGNTNDSGLDSLNGFVVKLDTSGNNVTDFNGIDGTLILNYEDTPGMDTTFTIRDMELLPNGQILLAGEYETGTKDIGLVLVNSNGEIDTGFDGDGLRTYNLSGGSLPNFNCQIEVASNGAVYMSAKVVNGANEDIVTVKLYGDVSGLKDVPATNFDFAIYPNPTAEELNINFYNEASSSLLVRVMDLSGRILVSQEWNSLSVGENKLSLTDEIRDLPSGTYMIRIESDKTFANQTFIKF